MNTKPIGIFDSGIGGTSIFKEIRNVAPYENTIYLADSKNAPYGEKSKDEIVTLCIKNTELLIDKGCKLIVVACNTATTNAIHYLRDTYNIPFIGIEPAIKPASLQTKTKAIGILATKGTLSSSLFHATMDLYGKGNTVIERVGEGIVPLIEAGKTNSNQMRELLMNYTKPMVDANIDYLVLGCTHYPYLVPLLSELLPNTIKIIDSGFAVARQTKAILETHGLLNTSKNKAEHIFYSNADGSILSTILEDNYTVNLLDF